VQNQTSLYLVHSQGANMVKLKNISQGNLELVDLGMQLLHPGEELDLEATLKYQASRSTQIIDLLADTGKLSVIDESGIEIFNVSDAVDVLKGYQQKLLNTFDNKLFVQNSPRPIGTFTTFSSQGDDPNNPHDVGNGQKFMIDHKIGDQLDQYVYGDFNCKGNLSYAQEGYGIWENANFDQLLIEIVPKVTPYTAGTNTYFDLYGGYLVVPAAGNGHIDIQPQDMRLVEIPFSIDDPSKRQSPAFWDADYDLATHQFYNIRPNFTAEGQYNMFTVELTFERIVNYIIIGSKSMNLKTNDVAEIAHGMRIRFNFKTNAPDHDWKMACMFMFNRQYTRPF